MVSREDRRNAELDIARLIAIYCHRLDGADFDGVASLFKDATWRISPTETCDGADAVRAWLENNLTVHGDKLGTRHIMSNVVTDVHEDGVTANTLSYGVVTQVTADFPIQVISQCRYSDTFVKVDGEWRFADREVLLDGFGDLSAHQANGWG